MMIRDDPSKFAGQFLLQLRLIQFFFFKFFINVAHFSLHWFTIH